MKNYTNKILLNEILNLDNVKIRFNLMFKDNWNPAGGDAGEPVVMHTKKNRNNE